MHTKPLNLLEFKRFSMRYHFLSTIAFLLTFFPALSQQIYFERTFGGPGSDIPEAVRQLPSGTIFVAGHSETGTVGRYDMTLARLDRYGNLQWMKFYGDTLDDYALGMTLTSDGGIVMVGETNTVAGGIDAIVMKVDTMGNEIWRRVFSTNVNESLRGISQTPDGGYIACGFQNDNYNANDSYVVKMDSQGYAQWQRTYGATDNDYANMIRPTPDGGYIMTADTKSFGAGGYDVEVIKMDNAGIAQWDSTYGDQLQNGCQGLIITAAGKYLSFGETEIYNGSPFNYHMRLIDTDGTTIWKKVFGGSATDAIFEVVEEPNGDFVCTGYSNHANAPLDVVVMRTDSVANVQWQRFYGTPFVDIGNDLVKSIDNGYLITGKTFVDDDEFYLLHVDQQGLVGVPSYDGSANPVKVFPNPSTGAFSFNLPGTGTYTMSIFSREGRLVRTMEISSASPHAELGDLKRGIYIAELKDEKALYHIKLILL